MYETHMKKENVRSNIIIMMLLVISIISIIFTLSLGAIQIPLEDIIVILQAKFTNNPDLLVDVSKSNFQIIWNLRMPRILVGFFVGCGLSISGLVMQAIVQNPMADPYLLGISSGATLGATISILFGIGFVLHVSAFAGALIACVFVIVLSSLNGKTTAVKLILSGMIVSFLFTAISNFIITTSGNSEGMLTVQYWTMGSLTRATWSNIWSTILVVFVGTIFFCLQSRPLNILLVGDEAARTLGLNLKQIRYIYLIIVALLTGMVVSTCGIIGFVGLIIPHIARALVGTNHKVTIPVCAFLGGIFMIWVDAIARSLIPQSELPLGIFTAIIGAPLFMYILIRKNYNFKN